MRCPSCEHDNTANARFCSNCGTRLERACPACGAHPEPGARFCDQCGTDLAAPPTSPEPDDLARYIPDELLRKIRAVRTGQTMRGERRTVTMLFADIQGSTSAAERLDPEEWAEIVNGAFGHLIAPIYRYEGTLARLQGDAILAFFGAPIAHEDDPVRAVRASLDMLEAIDTYRTETERRWGVPIAVRVGINTGLVVVGEVGSDLRVEYTALGDAINVAARMEQTAEPGTVRVTADTLPLLGGMFETAPIGPVEVRGRSDAVMAYTVLGPADDRGSSADAAGPLIGREAECERLEQAVADLRSGLGGTCTIVGEAGMGKSRLLDALDAAVAAQLAVATEAAQDGELAWLRGRSRSYERNVPHATFVQLLRGWWGPADGHRYDRIVESLAAAPDTADADLAAYLANLVGAPLPPTPAGLVASLSAPILHGRTTAAVTSYLVAEASRRPLAIVLDDLHWADPISLALIEQLMAVTASAPLLLVLVTRPNRDDPVWQLVEAAARDHHYGHTAIELSPLPPDATRELLEVLAGDLAVDAETLERILERSGGNPLFVSEIVRSLGDDVEGPRDPLGAQRVEVPASLTGLLTARLDRLEEGARYVAQVASVIGREFELASVAAVAGPVEDVRDQLDELCRRGILEERRRLPEPLYAFRHPLIRETAYSTVLLRTRRELHGRIAVHVESRDPAAAEEIARHHLEAGTPQLAFPHLIEAGRRATRAMALGDAISYFATALDAVPEDADPELVLAAHDGLGEAYSLVPDLSQAAAAYQSLLDYGRLTAEPSIQVTALNRLGFSTAAIAGDFDGALEYLQQARALAEETGDDAGLAEYHMNACFVHSFQGDLDLALQHDVETERIGLSLGNDTVRLVGLVRATSNLVTTLRFDEARVAYEQAREIALETGDAEAVAVLEGEAHAVFALLDGDLATAMKLLRDAVPTTDRFASLWGAAMHHRLAEYALLAGDVELALAEYASTERDAATIGQEFAVCAGLAGRARVLSASGMEGAAELREQVLSMLGTPASEFYATTVWTDLALANLDAGALADAASDFANALEASSVTMYWERPRISLGLTRLALARGEDAVAAAHLDEARGYVAAHGMRFHEPELLVLDGALATVRGELSDATVLLTEADKSASEMGRKPVRIEALARSAAARANAGDQTGATADRDRAKSILHELVSTIADAELRTAFERIQTSRIEALARSPSPA